MADNWQLKAVLSANAESMLKTLRSVNTATRTTRKHLADIGSSTAGLARSLALPVGLLGGLAAGFSLVGIKQAVTNFANLGDQVVKSAQRIGVSVPEYQRLAFIADRSGVSAEELGASVGRLNKNIGEAAAGKNDDLAALFKRAGISLRGMNGELRSGADLLPEVADLFVRNKNAVVQARIGTALYGKSWQALAPLLQGGSAGINELVQRYKELGIEVDEGALKGGEALQDQMGDLQKVVRSYGNTITAQLLPVLAPLVEKTIQWAVANRQVITTRVTGFLNDMMAAMQRIDWAAVVAGVNGLIGGLRSLVEWLGGARNALIALVLFMNASAIMATLSLLGAVGRLGLGLVALALKALAPVAPLQVLTAGLTGAQLRAATLTATMGRLGAATGVAGAAFAGFQFGEFLNDFLINPAVRALTGNKDATLGTAIFDALNPDPLATPAPDASRRAFNRASLNPAFSAAAAPPSLIAAQKGRVDGQVNININGLPQGSRVEQVAGAGSMPITTNVGFSPFVTKAPF